MTNGIERRFQKIERRLLELERKLETSQNRLQSTRQSFTALVGVMFWVGAIEVWRCFS